MRIQIESTGRENTFTLTQEETLVLLDFLSRFDKNGQPDIRDQAEQLIFWHLYTALKSVLPESLAPGYAQKIAAAREAVRNSA